jgi:hypothetical protein
VRKIKESEKKITMGRPAMEPSQELIDDIYRERVLRARRTPPAEKFLDGPRLFDYACRITKSGIRSQYPEASEQAVDEILAKRIALWQHIEGFRYSP